MKNSARLVCALTVASCVALAGQDNKHDSELASLTANIDKLHRVTDKPHPMIDSTIAFCRPAGEISHNLHEGFHEVAYCNVYVNESARKPMLTGKGVYPVGSVIIKSKRPSNEKSDIELFTVMRKMPDSYDPKNGNWEYAIVDGRSKRVFASGKIGSCISCHEAYKQTDYVTRTYMKQDGGLGDEVKSQ